MFGLGQQQPQQPIGENQRVEQSNQIPFYQKSEELGKQMLNTENHIEELKMRLQGYVWSDLANSGKGGYVLLGTPLCNEIGANDFIADIQTFVDQTAFLSWISDYDKVRAQRKLMKSTIAKILTNIGPYEIPFKISAWMTIFNIVSEQCYLALSRAVQGKEKGFFADVYQEKQVMSQNSQQQFKKGGFLGG